MKLLGFDISVTRTPKTGLAVDSRQSPENPSTPLSNPAAWLFHTLGARPTSSGVSVNEDTAMTLATLWSCVRLISETISSLPYGVYRRTPEGRELVPGPLTRIVGLKPNEVQTAMTLREVMQAHALTRGNAHAFIDRDAAARPRGLYLLNPRTTYAEKIDNTRHVYRTTLDSGEEITLGDYDVLHLMGLSGDGINGYSVVRVLRESIGLGLATQEYGSRFFSGDAKAEGVLQVPQVLNDEGYRRIRAEWNSQGSGLEGSHRFKILEQGTQYHQISIPPDDAQFLQTRDFQRQDIAAAFRVPGYMVGVSGDGSDARASTEQKALEFVKFALRAWLVRWEQECYRKLLPEGENERYFKHNLEGLLRGDFATRMEAYGKGRQWGFYSVNDIRRLEDQNSIGPDGDIYLSPVNMVPASQAEVVLGARAGGEPRNDRSNSGVDVQRYTHILDAACKRLAEREAEALRKAVERYLPEDPKAFDEWFERFAQRHAQNIADALGIEPAPYIDSIRRRLAAPGGLQALEHWADTQRPALLEHLNDG